MNCKIKLVSLGATVAIALLLPTQARANSPEHTNDEQPSGLTSGEAQPDMVLEVVPEVVPDVVSEEAVPDAITAESSQQPQTPDITAAEPIIPQTNASTDNSDPTQADALLPSSTNSLDLQLIEAPLAGDHGFQTPLAQPLDMAQTTSDPSQSEQWHFLLTPYVYIPFSISGSATFNNLNGNLGGSGGGGLDFDLEPNQIRTALRNNLNFALFSGFEAWNPNYKLGILSNFDYVSLSSQSTVNRDVRFPGLANFIPAQINADLTTQLMRADLAGSYRFYDPARVNPEGIRSEYDLGPLALPDLA